MFLPHRSLLLSLFDFSSLFPHISITSLTIPRPIFSSLYVYLYQPHDIIAISNIVISSYRALPALRARPLSLYRRLIASTPLCIHSFYLLSPNPTTPLHLFYISPFPLISSVQSLQPQTFVSISVSFLCLFCASAPSVAISHSLILSLTPTFSTCICTVACCHTPTQIRHSFNCTHPCFSSSHFVLSLSTSYRVELVSLHTPLSRVY